MRLSSEHLLGENRENRERKTWNHHQPQNGFAWWGHDCLVLIRSGCCALIWCHRCAAQQKDGPSGQSGYYLWVFWVSTTSSFLLASFQSFVLLLHLLFSLLVEISIHSKPPSRSAFSHDVSCSHCPAHILSISPSSTHLSLSLPLSLRLANRRPTSYKRTLKTWKHAFFTQTTRA